VYQYGQLFLNVDSAPFPMKSNTDGVGDGVGAQGDGVPKIQISSS